METERVDLTEQNEENLGDVRATEGTLAVN